MTGFVYLALLLLATGCMLIIDRRFRLFFWRDPAVAALITAIGTVLYLIWDIAGIANDIFFRGQTIVLTGVLLAPELPLEELFFLTFLVLCTMVIFTGSMRVLAHLEANRRGER